MPAGAPLGNKNARKENRLWRETILRSVKQKNSKGVEKMRAAADALVDKACDGDVRAAIEIGDRIDGKPAQTIDASVSGDLTINIVRFADNAA